MAVQSPAGMAQQGGPGPDLDLDPDLDIDPDWWEDDDQIAGANAEANAEANADEEQEEEQGRTVGVQIMLHAQVSSAIVVVGSECMPAAVPRAAVLCRA